MQNLPKVDVVTVGAGWTGGILAQQLTKAGYSVVSIEQGPLRTTESDFFHNHDELRFQVRRDLMVDLSQETWTWRPNPKGTALPMRQYGSFNPGKGVGGAGIHWAAQHWRFFPSDFEYRTHHVGKYGEDRLPVGNRIQDWPLNVFDAHYDSFEKEIIPIAQEQGIAVIGMKSFASGEVFRSGSGVTPQEALRYAMSLPVPTVVSGMDSVQILEQNLAVARDFQPLTDAERADILRRSAPHAPNGANEHFKSTRKFEGNEGRVFHQVDLRL